MTILPLYAAPQFAPQVTDWLWQAILRQHRAA